MRRLLVFQHVGHETLGLLEPLLRDAGFGLRHVDFHRQPQARPSPARYQGLIVLGGPMNCDEVRRWAHPCAETR